GKGIEDAYCITPMVELDADFESVRDKQLQTIPDHAKAFIAFEEKADKSVLASLAAAASPC
ncbi:MAG: hypothetical protein H7273_04965, partial [Polaromonas sp.]|nr:hypothetical protein [Polaromonas sp.]